MSKSVKVLIGLVVVALAVAIFVSNTEPPLPAHRHAAGTRRRDGTLAPDQVRAVVKPREYTARQLARIAEAFEHKYGSHRLVVRFFDDEAVLRAWDGGHDYSALDRQHMLGEVIILIGTREPRFSVASGKSADQVLRAD